MKKKRIIKLKVENKILRQRLISAQTYIDRINYMFNNSIGLHKHNENVIDQETFLIYKSKLKFVNDTIFQIEKNSKEILNLRYKASKCKC